MEDVIGVVVRIRPKGDNPSSSPPASSPLSFSDTTVSIHRETKKSSAEYTFDSVLGPDATQTDLFATCSEKIQGVLEGVNTCVMAYGQTGSGKTFSMLGKGWEGVDQGKSSREASGDDDADLEGNLHAAGEHSNTQTDIDEDSLSGVVPRSISSLFDTIDSRVDADENFNHSIHCTFMQIYNEKIYDLLQDKKRQNPLAIKEAVRGSSSTSVHVPGVSEYKVFCKDDVMLLIKRGLRNRAIRCTEFNAESSRSHTILQLFIQVEEQDNKGATVIKKSVLSLVDLAGSEKWRPSLSVAGGVNSDQYEHEQKQLTIQKEMTNINNSLTVLGTCISALLQTGRRHIPYRNSSLTRLLQDSLGGNGRTIFIVTVQGGEEHVEETYSTLQFASRASKVKTTIQPLVMVGDISSMDQARKEIHNLRARLSSLQTGVTNDGRSLSQTSHTDNSKIIELNQRINALEQENASLRKLVDPLLLSKIKSLINVDGDEPASNSAKSLLRASMEGNQSLRKLKGDKLLPSPASIRDPNITKRKLHLAKEKKIRRSIAALNRSLSPKPSYSPSAKSRLVSTVLPEPDALPTSCKTVTKDVEHTAHEAEYVLDRRDVDTVHAPLEGGAERGRLEIAHEKGARSSHNESGDGGARMADEQEVDFAKERDATSSVEATFDDDGLAAGVDLSLMQNIASNLRASIEDRQPSFCKSPGRSIASGQLSATSLELGADKGSVGSRKLLEVATPIEAKTKIGDEKITSQRALEDVLSEEVVPVVDSTTVESSQAQGSSSWGLSATERSVVVAETGTSEDEEKALHGSKPLAEIDVVDAFLTAQASKGAASTKESDPNVDATSFAKRESPLLPLDFTSPGVKIEGMKKGVDGGALGLDVDDATGARPRVVEVSVSPLTSPLASTPAGSVSGSVARSLVDEATGRVYEALATDADVFGGGAELASPLEEGFSKARKSRSALPSAQAAREVDSSTRSLQSHSAGRVKALTSPNPGKYVSEDGVSNIYASNETTESLDLLHRDEGEGEGGDYGAHLGSRPEKTTRRLIDEVGDKFTSFGFSDAAASYVAPSSASSTYLSKVDGECERHQLERCVLCSLFNNKQPARSTTIDALRPNACSKASDQSCVDPSAVCQTHQLKNCLLCRLKAEERAGTTSRLDASRCIQPATTTQATTTSRLNESSRDLAFDYKGLSDSEYIKSSIGREGLVEFEAARRRYEEAMMKGAERRGVQTKAQPSTYGDVKYDDEEDERAAYEQFHLRPTNGGDLGETQSWGRDDEKREDAAATLHKYLSADSGRVDRDGVVVYEDDELINAGAYEREAIRDDAYVSDERRSYNEGDSRGHPVDDLRRSHDGKSRANRKVKDERESKRRLPSLTNHKTSTKDARLSVKSDALSAYAPPPPEKRKKLVRKLTKAPRLNDPSVPSCLRPTPALTAKNEKIQDAKKSVESDEKKLDGLSNGAKKSSTRKKR